MGENGKDRIGNYELAELIGDGAQGRVYRARCVSDSLPLVKMDEAVALKVVRITGEDESLRIKFEEQAGILRRLSHTSIVSYRDCFSWHAGEWDEAQCLVMELLEGEPLNERLKKAGSGLPWSQVEEIFEQCLAGLIHAREHGVTHRDIKPSNIFLTSDGRAKLIDFDIARRDDSGQMSTAGWKGTFDYMAPDFITSEGFHGDEVSDIFSLSVCFYQALTGSLPYAALGDTAHIGYLNRWRNAAAPTPSFRPGVFRVLSQAKNVIAKGLVVARTERYQTFAEMLEDFRKIRYRRLRHKNKDEYELLAVLGRGGFGEVFKGRRASDGLLVAIKYLFSEKQSDRFLKEAKILQQYSHPNLVKYVDFMVIEGTGGEKQFFLVMEFLEGIPGWTLRQRIKNEERLDPAEVVPLFSSFLSALQFLHGNARPIIHRDIKPGNLYAPLGQPEKAKIFDLGVARDVSGTVTVGGVPGTLDYMAPEFAEAGGDRGSPQSDIYALGLCLYESLTGKSVFDRLPNDINSAWSAFQDRIRKPPAIAFDDAVFARYPRLGSLVLKALAEKPSARFSSATEMQAALQAALLPAEMPPETDDFDDGEMTMATFAVGAQPGPAEPGATLGTRPLDAVVPVAGDLIAAGKKEAARRRRRSRVLIFGGAAVGLLLLAAGGVVLVGRFRERSVVVAPKPLPPIAEPAVAAIAIEPLLVTSAPSLSMPAVKPVVTPPERDPIYQQLFKALPQKIAGEEAWLAAEIAAAALTAQERAAWAGVDDSEKAQRIASLRALLQVRATAYVESVRDTALEAYAKDRDGTKIAARLALMEKQAPSLKALVAASLQEAVTRTTAARDVFEAKRRQQAEAAAALQKAAEQRAAAVTQATTTLDALADRLRTGTVVDCTAGMTALAGIATDLLGDIALKTKWEAARNACRSLLTQALAQKDPLNDRQHRLQTVAAALAAKEADALFGTDATALRRTLQHQQSVCVLRLKNASAGPLQVSGEGIGPEVVLAAGAVRDWDVPVPDATRTVTVTARGSDRTLARTETIKLWRADAIERVFDEAFAKSLVPPPPTLAKPTPVTPATPVPVPATGAATPPAAVPPSAEHGVTMFDIIVSPKQAQVLVNGRPAAAGQVPVAPNENHQVSVTCKGYKPVQQYYRVKPGETRRIDILLEKEEKRSFLGF